MKLRKLLLLPAVCAALTLALGACSDDKTQNAEARAEAEKAAFILSDDGKTVTRVKDKSITSCVIPDGVTTIGEGAFCECENITNITIPDSVTSIKDGAFVHCRSLKSITIPDSVTSIGKEAFCECRNLTSVTIGNGVKSIGKYAFAGCRNLTSVTIGNGVKSVGQAAFADCKNLMSITVPSWFTDEDVKKWDLPKNCKITRK